MVQHNFTVDFHEMLRVLFIKAIEELIVQMFTWFIICVFLLFMGQCDI